MKQVTQIPRQHALDWIKNIHYAKRQPTISYAFGLWKQDDNSNNQRLTGVVTYGSPNASSLRKMCTDKYYDYVIELNRHILIENEPNDASTLIGRSLKMLPAPKVVVSYADMGMNHNGYIYQATNFLYTGISDPGMQYTLKSDPTVHNTTLFDSVHRDRKNKLPKGMKTKLVKEKYGDDLIKVEGSKKHRYIFFVGNKKQKKDMLKNLQYEILSYPKGYSGKYDWNHNITYQQKLM